MSKAEGGAPQERSITKIAVTAMAGASIEWYDFFVYGTAAALVFPRMFFPEGLPTGVAQLAAFSTFAVGFIARPIGGVLFGHYGDRFGRKRALIIALVTMGAATSLCGLLPSYEQVGVAAPLALIVLRFLQGLAVGGQWGGAVLLVTESAPEHKRGFYGSFAQVGVPVGVVLANVCFMMMTWALSPEAFQAWGWRVPFVLSLALIGLAIFIHTHLEETPEFKELAAAQSAKGGAPRIRRSPVLDVIRAQPRRLLLAGGAFVASNGCFYMIITYAIAYGTANLGLAQDAMLASVLIGSLVMVPLLLIFAGVSDRFGRRGIFMAGAALSGLWAFAFFPLIATGSFALITLAMTVGLLFLAMMYGPQAAFFAELFSAEVRYSGASLGYQLGAILGGGFAPMIATALFAESGSTVPVSAYMALLCSISFACVYALTETRTAPSLARKPAR